MTRKDVVAFVEKLNGIEMGYLADELMAASKHEAGLPKHPDFVYRLSGEWKGWADFLGKPLSKCSKEELAEIRSLQNA